MAWEAYEHPIRFPAYFLFKKKTFVISQSRMFSVFPDQRRPCLGDEHFNLGRVYVNVSLSFRSSLDGRDKKIMASFFRFRKFELIFSCIRF